LFCLMRILDIQRSDKYDNGVITKARLRCPYWGKSSRLDKNRNPQLQANQLPDPSLGGEKMIRRFVNVVAENIKSGMHSLHRLDVSKHLFYPSAAEAKAAAAALKRKSSGWAPQIPILECLPAHSICFRPTPTTRWDNASMEFFALLSPRRSESRIFCSTNSGHSVLYHADSQCVQCMPSLQDEFIGRRPITFSRGPFHLASRCTVIQVPCPQVWPQG